MKKRTLIACLCALGTGAAAAANLPYSTIGVVQQADSAARTVTVAHQPVPSLNWPATAMQFSVPEAALFERLPPGEQVAFEFVQQDGGWRIVNAIPLAQAGAPVASARPGRMQPDMSMREICIDMMSRTEAPRR